MKKFYRFVACLLSVVLCVSLAPRRVVVLVSADSELTQEFTGYAVRNEEDYKMFKEELGSIAPLIRECDRYSMLSDAEKDKILALYEIEGPEMEELEELGFSISTSAQYARVMNTYDLSMEEVIYAADMFGDVNLLAVELRRFEEFTADKELSQEMIDHVRAMVLEGHEYVEAVYSYMAAQVMQMDAETASASSSGMQAAPVRRSLLSEQEESLLDEETLWSGEEDLQESESAVDENIVALSEFYAIEPEVLQGYLDEAAIDTEEFKALVEDAILELYPSEEETEENTSLLQNQLNSASMTASISYSAMSDTGEEEDVVSAPFTYQKTEYESVNLNTGEYMYEETDLVLPGKNGLDLVLMRRYDSSDANIEIPYGCINDPDATVYTLQYAYYLQSAGTNDLECYESNRIPEGQYDRYTWGYGNIPAVMLHESARVMNAIPTNPNYNNPYTYSVEQDDGIWYYWNSFVIENMSIQFRLKDKDYMMYCIDQYIAPTMFASTDTVTGESIGILAQPEITVDENALRTAAYSGTSSLVNAYSQNRYGLGIGWSYAFTSIDKYFDTTYETDLIANETHFMLNLADGRKFRVNFENGDTAEIEGYLGENIILTTQNQGGTNQTYTVRYADGKTETMNKDGFITQIKDRYNNSINFTYEYTSSEYDSLNRAKKMTITDTLGRVVTLDDFQNNSSKRILTAPDGTTKEFTLATENSNGWIYKYLTEVKDENGCVTKYGSRMHQGQYNVFSPYPISGMRGIAEWRQLQSVQFATNVEGEGTWSLRFDLWVGIRHISNGVGHQEYVGLRARYIYTTKVGQKRLDMTIYSYKGDPTAYGHTYLWVNENATKYSATTQDWYHWMYIPEGRTSNSTFRVYYGGTRYEFDRNNRLRREKVYTALTDEAPYIHSDQSNKVIINPDVRIQERDYTYGWTEKPISIIERTYNYAGGNNYVERSHLYEYDWTGNVTKYTDPVGHVTEYTYDISTGNYNMPLTKTYKRDANTTIKEQYTLTADKKDIKIHEAYENNVRKQKTEYTYDTYGNVIKERRYKDGFTSYYDTDFSYSDNQSRTSFNGAYVTQKTVAGVLNNSGGYATSTPGRSSGTIVEKTYYDLMGRVQKTVDPNGRETEYERDLKGNVSSITYPDQSVVSYERDYETNDLITTDANGTQIKYVYDPVGKLEYIQDVESEQILSTYGYDFFDNLREEVNYSSEDTWTRTEYGVDRQGRVVRTEMYDEEENLLYHETMAYQDAYENTSSLSKNHTRTTKTVHGENGAPDIVTTEYTDKLGNIAKRGYFFDGTEYIDTFTYDYLGNRLSSLTALDASNGRSYTAKWEYDYANRPVKETNALGQSGYKAYDALGRNTSATNHAGTVATFTYDALDRLLTQTTPFENVSGTVYSTVKKYDYDPAGNVTREQTQNNVPGQSQSFAKTEYQYDNRDRLVEADSYNGTSVTSRVRYEYDATGNLTAQKTGYNPSSPSTAAVTTYTYDRFGNVESLTDPLGQVESSTYDLVGNLTSKTDRDGAVTAYTYDGLGRPLNTTVTKDGAVTGQTTVAYTLTGQKQSIANSNHTTTYTYDALGRLTQESETGSVVKTYTYDIGGNRTEFKLKVSGLEKLSEAYEYDALNRLKTVKESNATRAQYTYDTNGNRATLTYGNGVTTTYTYNLANLVKQLQNKKNSAVQSSYVYEYYLDGNQRTKTDHVGRVSTYTYDGLGRLTNEAESGATDATTYAYTYDSRSNRATLTASGAQSYTTAYNYDINDRLLQTTKTMGQTKEIVNYQYDANGNTLSALTETLTTGSGTPSLSLGSDGGYELYTYNGFNQLVSTIQDSVETTYVYKPDGLRYNKATNGTTTTHIWDGVNIAAELTGSTVTTYVRGINLITKGGGSQYYSFNAHGDVVQLTNSSGTVTKNYRYDAFGVEVDPQGTDTNPWRYCGEYWDKETGTVYLRARYYDPATSRMLSEDPMRAELNWYTYCGNNPVTYWDPLGLERIAISGGAYAAPDSVHADGFKYNFIETALRQIMDWLNLDGDEAVMWIIADAGWSAKEKKEFQGWADYRGFGIKFVDNKQQVFDYINNKDGNGRSKDPVTAFSVFSHGFASNDGVVSLGYNYTRNYNKNLDICKSDIFDMIETSSFRSPTSKFYSCNTGTSGNGSFAQAWVNKFGGVTTAFVGQSYYGNINVVGPFFEKLAKKIDRIVFGYTPSGSFDYPVAGDNASSQIFHRTIPMAGGRRAARRW